MQRILLRRSAVAACSGAHAASFTSLCAAAQQQQPRTMAFFGCSGVGAAPAATCVGAMRWQSGSVRPGDWACPSCGFNNFGSRITCKNCSHARPNASPAAAGGDAAADGGAAAAWSCPSCSLENPGDVAFCVACSFARPAQQRPAVVGSGGGMAAAGSGAATARPGDWECPTCRFHNFRRNGVCKSCGGAKPAAAVAAAEAPPAAAAAGAKPPAAFKPGDWNCPKCKMHNFANRGACLSCGASKPQAGSAPRPGDWLCPACGVNNFATRRACFKCNVARPENKDAASSAAAPAADADTTN